MSFSVPTSPAMPRSTKAQPITPQRIPRQQPRSQSFYRSPLTPCTSPYTPLSLRSVDSTGSSTLTTPDNSAVAMKKRLAFSAGSPDIIRNATATQDKSVADIAENWRSRANDNGIKVSFGGQDESHYVADDSGDLSLSDVANDSSIISTEEALLAPPFLTKHRRLNSLPNANRPRALSQASLPSSRMHPLSPITSRTVNCTPQTSSPLQSRRTPSMNYSMNLMSTPPPNRSLARQLKLKGSLTDPAQSRRREAFDAVPILSNNIGNRNASRSLAFDHDTSLNLFDIDENDFESEHDYQDPEIDNSFSRNLQTLHSNASGYPTFTSQSQAVHPQALNHATFADPFQPDGTPNGLLNRHVLNGIAEHVEHHFHASRQQPLQNRYYEGLQQPQHVFYAPMAHFPPHCNQAMPHPYPTAAVIPIPQSSALAFQSPMLTQLQLNERPFSTPKPYLPVPVPESPPTDCSVCLTSHPATLAILQPCRHPLCSTCLTSALNIVGEKDMECAVCKKSVADFKLVVGASKGDRGSISPAGPSAKGDPSESQFSEKADQSADIAGISFMEPLSSSPGNSNAFEHEAGNDCGDLGSAFEFGRDLELRASTPKLEQQSHECFSEGMSATCSNGKRGMRKGEDNVVLRIDNVPWDITPLQITKWLQQPVERVHVLLDGKGKTLSHAYVEVRDAFTAGAILRGETLSSNSFSKKERGSVLGRGRRARGVTVTRSGQQELMSDLFPHWRGGFDGSRPSLAGLEGERIIGALEGGLLTKNDISGLLHLIREPDSHFLKVPSLPFHSLISLLSKFPADVDSRVFWSSNVRDQLFEAIYVAMPILVSRVEKAQEATKSRSAAQEEEYTMDLAIDLLHTGMDSKAFTMRQIQRLVELAQSLNLPLPQTDVSRGSDPSDLSLSTGLMTPSSQDSSTVRFYRGTLNNLQGDKIHPESSLDDLAREFGIDAHVVQALAQRLAKLR